MRNVKSRAAAPVVALLVSAGSALGQKGTAVPKDITIEGVTIQSSIDPVPPSAYPVLSTVTGSPPTVPSQFASVALLHPFSPPPSTDPQPDNPFYQLCVASIVYKEGEFLSAQIAGVLYGKWWYVITPEGTRLSTDEGGTWNDVDMGWTLPTTNFFGDQVGQAKCAGASPLNWMGGQPVDWWKIPVPGPKPQSATPVPGPKAQSATWFWFNDRNGQLTFPLRMMFGQGPPKPTKGDPSQLALFQMYSFTYFPDATAINDATIPSSWTDPTFAGFAPGNAENYQKFTWNTNFGMTVFMTPVNVAFNPLPTRVLYEWKSDAQYKVYTDRAQNTLMNFNYSPQPEYNSQVALLIGPAPEGVPPPPNSDTGFIFEQNDGVPNECGPLPFPTEPPNWVSIPAVEGTIQACITDNPFLCPQERVMVVSVLFPPAPPNYPEATYLWTWYSPFPGSDGSHSRPVVFMQSQSTLGVGTSLALADYFYYNEFSTEISPENFAIPDICLTKN